ncbi:MAG: heparinase II/III family protein [Pseudomonadota bacterium]
MFAYHLKRVARNKISAKSPSMYQKYIDGKVASLPAFRMTGRENVCLAEKVAAFYAPKYRDVAEDAAKGALTLFGHHVDFGTPEAINWHATIAAEDDFHLWRQKLGHMGFVCSMLVDRKAHQLEAVSRIIDGYRAITRYDEPGAFTSYLFPYSVSHRMLALISGFIIAQSKGGVPQELETKLQDFLRWNAGFVLGNIEHELKNNHVERNLAALCLYLDALDGVPPRLVRRLDRDVSEIIEACILPDGLLAERSAMYQGLAVMALMVFAEARILTQATRDFAQERLDQAMRAWAVMTHPDGEICLFNDSWWGEVPTVDDILQGSVPMSRLELLEHAGYARLQGSRIFGVFDAGAIGPTWNPGHGHSDFLSAEVDVDGLRFIVDPGTYQYSTGARRLFERAAQSHNGPCWTDVTPVEYQGCFKVGKMAAAEMRKPGDVGDAQISGQLALKEGTARREIQLQGEDTLRFKDSWSTRTETAQVKMIIQGEWALSDWTENQLVFSAGDRQAVIAIELGALLDVRDGQWARRYLQSESATFVIMKPACDEIGGSARLVWTVSAGA